MRNSITCKTSDTDFKSFASMRKGQRCTSLATNAPSPCRVVTSPSARNAATASRTTVRLTPVSADNSCSVGSREPGGSRPLRISAASRWASSCVRLSPGPSASERLRIFFTMADHISKPIASLTVQPDPHKRQFPRCQRYSPNFQARRTGGTIMPKAPTRVLKIDRLDKSRPLRRDSRHDDGSTPQIRPCTQKAYHEIGSSYKWLVPGRSGWYVRERDRRAGAAIRSREEDMRWTTPVVVETCFGMEVTSYASAAI